MSPFIIVVCKKWPENSNVLASNVRVADNWYLAIIGPRPILIVPVILNIYWPLKIISDPKIMDAHEVENLR